MLEVKSTIDYDSFKTPVGNRYVNPTHVRRVIASLSKNNFMDCIPVLVNEKMEIIDGQHRVAAARHLHIPVHYVVVPDTDIDTVRNLNSSLKPWTVMDFVESYMKSGIKDYQTLYEFAMQYGIPITTAAMVLAGNQLKNNRDGKKIRDGLFRVTNLQNAECLMSDLKRMEPYTEGKIWISREFISAFIIFLEKGGITGKLIDQMEKRSDKIRHQIDYRRYLIVLQDIYNFQMKKEKISII